MQGCGTGSSDLVLVQVTSPRPGARLLAGTVIGHADFYGESTGRTESTTTKRRSQQTHQANYQQWGTKDDDVRLDGTGVGFLDAVIGSGSRTSVVRCSSEFERQQHC
jgi:hypothetical protein